MTKTKQRIAVWLLAMLLVLVAVFAMTSANSVTTDDAYATAKAGGTE